MIQENNNISASHFWLCMLIFAVWPLLGTIIGLYMLGNSKYARIVFTLFIMVMGLNTLYINVTGDAGQYAIYFQDICTFGSDFSSYLQQGRTDILIYSTYGLTAAFTNDPKYLFAFWGMFWGLFSFSACSVATKYRLSNDSMILFVATLFFLNAPTNMQTFRFFVCVWLFLYLLLNALIYENKKKWISLFFVTPLVHTSFFLPIVVYFIYRCSQKKNVNLKLAAAIFVLCFGLGTLSGITDVAMNYQYLLGESKYSHYLDEKTISLMIESAENRSSLASFAADVTKYLCFIIVMLLQVLIIKRRNLKYEDELTYNLNLLLLVFGSFSYLLIALPSMSRFMYITYMLLVVLVYRLIDTNVTSYKTFYKYILLVCFFGLYYLSVVKIPERYSLNFLLPFGYLSQLYN